MRRGFKAEAERLSTDIRGSLGKKPTDSLDPVDLARHVGAEVRRADELLSDPGTLQELEELQPGAFSACTFRIGERDIIVYNHLSSRGRTNSDIAHETAHLVLEHEMTTVESVGPLSFFTCDPEQEQEANWLAGCFLLPRPLLLKAAKRGLGEGEIADKYEVSLQMAAFRLRATGVARQMNARR